MDILSMLGNFAGGISRGLDPYVQYRVRAQLAEQDAALERAKMKYAEDLANQAWAPPSPGATIESGGAISTVLSPSLGGPRWRTWEAQEQQSARLQQDIQRNKMLNKIMLEQLLSSMGLGEYYRYRPEAQESKIILEEMLKERGLGRYYNKPHSTTPARETTPSNTMETKSSGDETIDWEKLFRSF